MSKVIACCVIAFVLGVQVWIIVPRQPKYRMWYWPFVNYPMFSSARYPGDGVDFWILHGVECSGKESTRELKHADLHIRTFNFFATLRNAAKIANKDPQERQVALHAQQLLSRMLNKYFPGEFCSAQVWRRSAILDYRIDTRELPEPELVTQWSVIRPSLKLDADPTVRHP